MIMADTGFWLALLNPKDKYHIVAKKALEKILFQQEEIITTCAVVTETCHLLLQRMGNNAQKQFLESYRKGAFITFEIQTKHLNNIVSLMEKYANLPMDLADASLVILAEELGHGKILSTDQRDFNTYRWKKRYPFENILLI
jgi:uncharacterized protein